MNIKIKKKILVCMLWLCAIACFTGFPWIFFSWDVIHSYMGIHDIPSDLTIVLFREECLFFGFFCIYFLFLRNIEKYKGLISFCSFLVAFMGGFMYLLKLQTGIVHISSDFSFFSFFSNCPCCLLTILQINFLIKELFLSKGTMPIGRFCR